MGRVPLMLILSCSVLAACAPDAPETPPATTERTDEAVRDAGDAAREAMKKAGDALRLLGGGGSRNEEAPPAAAETAPKAEVPASGSLIAPIPDETQQLEADVAVKRDASVATQEATERLVEATRRAAERVRDAGKGVVEAFRKDGDSAAGAEANPIPVPDHAPDAPAPAHE